MNIMINGTQEIIDSKDITVSSLLDIKKVKMPDMVSVQVNGDFIERQSFPETKINEEDEVDFLYFMGGGEI